MQTYISNFSSKLVVLADWGGGGIYDIILEKKIFFFSSAGIYPELVILHGHTSLFGIVGIAWKTGQYWRGRFFLSTV